MAPKYGAGTSVWLDLVDASQFFNEAGVEISVDTAETTTFQPGASPAWKSFTEGVASSKATLKGSYDKVNDAAMFANIRDGGSVLTYGPQGITGVGDPARLVWVHNTAIAESSPIGGAVLFSAAFAGDASVGLGWALHAMTTDTGTTTGATRNDLAASTAGWQAHRAGHGPEHLACGLDLRLAGDTAAVHKYIKTLLCIDVNTADP